jgi:putative tricarboxylic transport membrane protein
MRHSMKAGVRAAGAAALSAAGLVLAAAALGAAPAAAETRGPEGPVEITVGTSPGGTPDVIMRQVARIMNETGIVENPLVVQNRTGGSWAVSANHVISREGDENLLYAIAQPIWTTPITQGLDTFHDKVTPIAIFVQGDLIVVTHADAEEDTLADFVERAREEPLSVSVAGAQAGTTAQIATSLIEQAGEVEFNYIPYDGGGAATAAFLGRNSDLVILSPFEAVPLIEGGQVKPLAILNEERREEEEIADIPTARELGLDVTWGQTWGIAGPPNMDPELAQWWSDRFEELVESEQWRAVAAENFFRREFTGYDAVEERMEELFEEHLEVLRSLDLAQL